MLSINTNLSSIIVQGNLQKSTDKLNLAIERMTTGYKINHASDNAANFSIATNMDTKIGAYMVAEENAMMAMDMINTGIDTLSLLSSKASRLRELAVFAQSETNDINSLECINNEAISIIKEIYKIKNNSNYNNISLFGGVEREVELMFNDTSSKTKCKFIENVTRIDTTLLQTVESLDESVVVTGGVYSVSSPNEIEKALSMIAAGTLKNSQLVLANNVDYSEYSGVHTRASSVKFDGNGYVIFNFKSDGSFFADGGVIKNLGFENAEVIGNHDGQGILGRGNISATNCYVTGKVVGKNQVGGLVGFAKGAKIKNCFADVDVKGGHSVGGLIGYLEENESAIVENSYSSGAVEGYHYNVGGLIGALGVRADRTTILKNCASNANVKSRESCIGGLIGSLSAKGNKFTMENCYSMGSVVSTGTISDPTTIGGLIGKINVLNEIKNCYYLKETSKCSDEGKGLGVNITELFSLIDSSVLKDYDFELPLPDIYDDTSDNLYSPSSVNFQLGTSAKSSAGIFIDLTFKMEGLRDICYLGLTNENSINKLDAMLCSIQLKETELGTIQNRLMSVLEEISVQYDNLVSARSTIKDADMAEVSATYIQQQILQEASATLLATANQTPALALQLL